VLSCVQLAAVQAIDMRERVSALRRLPVMAVNVDLDAEALSLLESPRQEAILSRVYAGPRQDARELGVLIGRRVQRDDGVSGIDVVCRMGGEAERPRWLTVSSNEVEGGAIVLAMAFRDNGWALLPPTACGLPVWWPMRTTDLIGRSDADGSESVVPWGLYQVPAVRGQIAYTGRPAVLDPEQAYRILRIHDGVIELRQEWVLDTADGSEGDAGWLAWARRQPIPPTIRIRIADLIDADGRLHVSAAYPYGC
jgi:hypothetical protein